MRGAASRLVAGLITVSLAACQSMSSSDTEPGLMTSDVWVESRDIKIPATLVIPENVPTAGVPLVLLIHGHGGTRHEAGGFTRVADDLARRGIASIRMDFPGCGDSREGFEHNNLTNMLADVRAAEAYAAKKVKVDPARTGLLGFSMGGRVASLLAASERRFGTLVLWAAGADEDETPMVNYVGGQERWDAMKAEAAANGFAPFTTFWGQQQKLGPGFFTDLETNNALAAIREFHGELLILYGDADEVIDPTLMASTVEQAVNASEIKHVIIEGAGHGLGLFSERPDYTDIAVNSSVEFFAKRL